MYLNCQKAFHKVPCRRLLAKVRAYGLARGIANCIRNWVSDRKQGAVVSQRMSGWEDVSRGVPRRPSGDQCYS